MKNFPTEIKTQNLILRTLDAKDAVDVQSLLAINKQYMLPWIPWAKKEPESVEEKKKQILEWKETKVRNEKLVYGVFEKSSNKLVGMTFAFTRRGPGTLEIGYIIDFRQQGKGYATEASAALTKIGLEQDKVEKMLIYCSAENRASAKIPEKLGYHHETTFCEKEEDGSETELMIWVRY